MSTVQVTKTAAAATFSSLDSAAKLLTAVKKALADGWQPGQDIPAVIGEAVRDIGTIVSNLGDVTTEAGGDKVEFYNAIGLGVGEILGALRS